MAFTQVVVLALIGIAPSVAGVNTQQEQLQAAIQVSALAVTATAPSVAGIRTQQDVLQYSLQEDGTQAEQDDDDTPAPIPQDDDGTPVGVKCTEEGLAQIQKWMNAGVASFDEDKEMVMKCACQNYVFTAQQAATLIGMMTWSKNQADAVEMFRDRLTNPKEGKDILEKINDKEKSKVTEMLKKFKDAKPVEILAYPLESAGVRADEDVKRFVKAVNDAFMSKERKEAVEKEMQDKPAPPFSATQLGEVLSEFKFGSEVPGLLEILAAPRAIYPLTCAEIEQLTNGYATWDRLKMLEVLKPLIKDAQNKPLLVAGFEFPSDKAKAEVMLRDVTVKFKLVPPEAKIQAAIKAVGACSSGYTWQKVKGGWRCAAGGHFLSDEVVNQKVKDLK